MPASGGETGGSFQGLPIGLLRLAGGAQVAQDPAPEVLDEAGVAHDVLPLNLSLEVVEHGQGVVGPAQQGQPVARPLIGPQREEARCLGSSGEERRPEELEALPDSSLVDAQGAQEARGGDEAAATAEAERLLEPRFCSGEIAVDQTDVATEIEAAGPGKGLFSQAGAVVGEVTGGGEVPLVNTPPNRPPRVPESRPLGPGRPRRPLSPRRSE